MPIIMMTRWRTMMSFFPLVLEKRADGAPKHEKIFMHR